MLTQVLTMAQSYYLQSNEKPKLQVCEMKCGLHLNNKICCT